MGDDADALERFLDLLQKFLHAYGSEFIPHVNKVVVQILNDVFYKDKPSAFAMEEILWYLADAFPKHVEHLTDMEYVAEQEIALLDKEQECQKTSESI